MQIHQLQPKHKIRGRKRVGRGGRKGTYSGRGMKGQKQRAGRKMVPIIRELIKRYPKLKGYRRFVLDKNIVAVNLKTLEKISKDGDVINAEALVKRGVISNIKGRTPEVKILGGGELSKRLIIENCKLSEGAKKAVEKAGGTIK